MKTIRPPEEESQKAVSQLTLLVLGTQVGGMALLIALSIWQFRETTGLMALIVLGILGYMVVTIVLFWRGSRARLVSWRHAWLVVDDDWIEQRHDDGKSVRVSRGNSLQVQENAFWMNVFDPQTRNFIGIPKTAPSGAFSEMRTAVLAWQKGGNLAVTVDSSRGSSR